MNVTQVTLLWNSPKHNTILWNCLPRLMSCHWRLFPGTLLWIEGERGKLRGMNPCTTTITTTTTTLHIASSYKRAPHWLLSRHCTTEHKTLQDSTLKLHEPASRRGGGFSQKWTDCCECLQGGGASVGATICMVPVKMAGRYVQMSLPSDCRKKKWNVEWRWWGSGASAHQIKFVNGGALVPVTAKL